MRFRRRPGHPDGSGRLRPLGQPSDHCRRSRTRRAEDPAHRTHRCESGCRCRARASLREECGFAVLSKTKIDQPSGYDTGKAREHNRSIPVVTGATVQFVTSNAWPWMVLVVRLPAEPSRHRVAVWRELRRLGALSLGQGVWTLPARPAFSEGVERALKLVERGDGDVVVLDAVGHDKTDAA